MSSRTGEATPNPVLDISRFCDLHEEGYLELHFALVLEIIRAAAQPMPCGSYLVVASRFNRSFLAPLHGVYPVQSAGRTLTLLKNPGRVATSIFSNIYR